MAKKHKAKSQRMRRRIMRRRISLIVGIFFVVGILFAEIFLGLLGEAPEWIGSRSYYGLVLAGLLIGSALLFFWNETGEKTDIDELEDRMEQLFRTQTQATKKQTQAINKLVQEIRTDRRHKDE